MTASTTDRIEQQVFLRAPRARVWQALTDWRAFGQWFGVVLDGPFRPGGHVNAAVTTAGYEHVRFDIQVQEIVPEQVFSWRWHPHAIDPARDYSSEPTTLVVFRLEAYRGNSEGWAQQMKSIERYVSAG